MSFVPAAQRLQMLQLAVSFCISVSTCAFAGGVGSTVLLGGGGPNLDQRNFRSVGVALGVPRAREEKMLAGGHINRLGDRTRNVICLIHGLTVEANRPLSNGSGARCDCIHLDMAWILAWGGAFQPNAGYSSVLVVISESWTAACRAGTPRSAASSRSAATSRSAASSRSAGAWAVGR